ncbi:MAG: MgtC/SapB family protein [Pegethrix bostrychoides GSE-TBD4-15B]|jgi:putative Mg2+ transporter-C (MgtC) family protein|uniref:MgtC/SapB family protein n=1 Tax=Pegethrix bostrychoides GSE-TBD4-15B TaxID=2839662 RepID=A0A951PF12_9CYAN|nr:MgtC/SapB family protein [Pegethrix bostrychoides GSE-TBD4-15B]
MLNTGLSLLAPVSELDLLLRIGLSMLVGGLIGLERELDRKPAGLRTYMLVSLGAALFILVGIQTGMVQADPSVGGRIIQGLVAGIGFLGAGEIFLASTREEPTDLRVKGLTSAAAVWVAAALGTAAGCGLWLLSLTGAGLTLLVLWIIKKLEVYLQ